MYAVQYTHLLVLVASYGISLASVLRMLEHMFMAPHLSKKYIIYVLSLFLINKNGKKYYLNLRLLLRCDYSNTLFLRSGYGGAGDSNEPLFCILRAKFMYNT